MKIKVYRSERAYYLKNEILVEEVNRKPFNKGFVGNFVPHWCRYKGKKYLVQGSIDHAYMHGFEDDAYIIVP